VTAVQEIELFMSEADKSNHTFFPKSVPPEASRCVIPYSFALVTHCFRAQISPRHCARGRGQVLLLLCKCIFTLRLCSQLRCRAGPSEYQGLMNALKRKMDEGTSETQDSIAKTQDSISQMKKETQDSIAKTQDSISQMKQEFQVQLADAQKETQKEMQKLQGQLAEIMQILRSRPSA
jgi:hypothetical protein